MNTEQQKAYEDMMLKMVATTTVLILKRPFTFWSHVVNELGRLV
jgi:hypothetical protein